LRCSFDKGFYTPDNRERLTKILDHVVLPKKGRLSEKDKQIETAEEFVESRCKHSAVESSINALENHGLDRCLDHGLHGFKRYVALSVVAMNIQILGHLIQQKDLSSQRRRKAA
jgi:transposase, IS5 family